jgi:hypothetical protein
VFPAPLKRASDRSTLPHQQRREVIDVVVARPPEAFAEANGGLRKS